MPYQAYRLAAVGPKGLSGAPERRQQLQSLYFDSTMAGQPPFLACSLSIMSTGGASVMLGGQRAAKILHRKNKDCRSSDYPTCACAAELSSERLSPFWS